MSLQSVLASTQTFAALEPIIQQAEVHLSFWGSKYVTVTGYGGNVSIHAMPTRVMELVESMRYELSEAERQSGQRISARINQMYVQSDATILQSNIITKVIFHIRQIVAGFFNWYNNKLDTRDWWEEMRGSRLNIAFHYYTRTQFLTTFGFPPEETPARGLYNVFNNPFNRLYWSSPRPRTNMLLDGTIYAPAAAQPVLA